MARFDLPLDELRGFRPEVAEPADFDDFWAATIAAARAVPTAPVLRPVDGPITPVRRVRRDVRRLRRRTGGRLADRAARPSRRAARRRRVRRVRRWARPGARAAGLAGRGLRPLPDGHPRPGQQLGHRRRHPRPVRERTGRPRFPDPRHRQPADLLLPKGFHRRCPSSGCGAAVPTDRRRPRRGHRREPGRRDRARGRRPGRRAGRRDAGRAVSLPLRARGRDDRRGSVRRDRAVPVGSPGPGRRRVPNAVLLRRRQLRQASDRAQPVLGRVAGPITPPSTVFAAHNAYLGATAIEVYPFNEHEGGQGAHWVEQARWLAALLG